MTHWIFRKCHIQMQSTAFQCYWRRGRLLAVPPLPFSSHCVMSWHSKDTNVIAAHSAFTGLAGNQYWCVVRASNIQQKKCWDAAQWRLDSAMGLVIRLVPWPWIRPEPTLHHYLCFHSRFTSIAHNYTYINCRQTDWQTDLYNRPTFRSDFFGGSKST